jgi:hypothetical protein
LSVLRYLARTIAVLAVAAATFTVGVFLLGAFNIVQPATAAPAHAACTMIVNSGACLDPSNIDDYRGPVGTEMQVAGRTWVVTVSGLEPVSAN